MFFYWTGVVMWAIACLFVLVALAKWLGMNIPMIERGNGWTRYKLGIGEVVAITDAELVNWMVHCGYRVHIANRYFWTAKILRFTI